MSYDSNDAVGSLEWLQSWAELQHAALVETLKAAEAGTVTFNGRFGADEIGDITEALSDKWRCSQVRRFFTGDESAINLQYAPPKPGAMERAFEKLASTLPNLPNVPPQPTGSE